MLNVLAVSPLQSAPMRARGQTCGNPCESLNWSGYAVTGSAGSVSDAKGSWIVPTANCAATPGADAAFWVGIDGFSDSTVEQTGVLIECSSSGTPTYLAWFELFPRPAFQITSVSISPGDTISAEVKYSFGKFFVYLTDLKTGQSFTTSASVGNAQRTSAEWIAEAPSSGGSILPLADFTTAFYGSGYTSVPNTSSATVNGVSGPISSFSHTSITMVTSSGVVKASPSGLSTDGTSFSVTWVSSG